jgi:hypothetical protein
MQSPWDLKSIFEPPFSARQSTVPMRRMARWIAPGGFGKKAWPAYSSAGPAEAAGSSSGVAMPEMLGVRSGVGLVNLVLDRRYDRGPSDCRLPYQSLA